nr:diguanylate cyclase [Lachnospiraceae bacterium]
MKDKNIIDKTMHFLVHNSFMFTVVIMCLVHLTLLVLMSIEKVTPLIQINMMSVIVYLFCIVLSRFGHIMPVYISLFLEVSIYVTASSYYIGWKCGSVCFLCSIVPIIIYFGSFLFKGKQRWIIVFLLTLNYAMYVALYLLLSDVKPVFEVSVPIQKTLMIFASFVMIFSVIFYSAIYIYSSEYQMVSLEEKNQKLSVDAKEDALTSLLNRRGFLPVVESLMKSDTPTHFCVSFCDIDNFKRINDSYG